MPVKRTLTLVLTFRRDDADTATRTVRALLKWLLRSWGMRAESYRWEDDPPPQPPADHAYIDDPERWGVYRD